MSTRYPAPLRPGDTVGVTAPSSGVGDALRPRLDHNVRWLRERGYEVWVGECLGDDRVVSAPKEQRAAELMAMLRDPTVRAVVPPWGGELAIDLLDQLDWDELATLEPTWLVGYSDLCSLLLPFTTLLGWATVHGTNLMDTAYRTPEGLRHWTELVSGPGPFVQVSPGRHRVGSWDDYRADPAVEELTLDGTGSWEVVGGGGLDVTGRLVGGCVEIVSLLAATPYGDVPGFGRTHADEGLVVFLEVAEADPATVARSLHSLRLAGWFEEANAVLVGRTPAPDADRLSQREAVLDALGSLDVPLVLGADIGHTQPWMSLVTGAAARVVVEGDRAEVTQTLD
ncbi:S66 family peptidase [Nocardioides plantarum]|uniref:S66 peptidase family protein n=1 Tax=Nocardioides plantarum TaxID=29299 RepID=A0ABV5K601_9ACTN|nr:S66 peptidase family protein [Nocardioides plantarum]